jgi:hypothetical protein
MPVIIEHIDAIARQKQRGVLYIDFRPTTDDEELFSYDYEDDERRQALLDWLDQQGIAWCRCVEVASEDGFEDYAGQIYIDLALDESNPTYCLLRDHLECPDGSMRDSNMTFYHLPLETAMQNAHHDEPGFWERWAKDF